MTHRVPELFAIAKVVKAFGVRGEVIAHPMTDARGRFRRLKAVFVGVDPDHAERADIEHVAADERGVRLKLSGVHDRTEAEKLVGSLLFVDAAHRVRIPPGTYFIHDVLGMSVVDEEGRGLGSVREVLRLPGHDVYVISAQGRELMLPAVKEFVRSIDVKSGTMTVRLIEGMLEQA